MPADVKPLFRPEAVKPRLASFAPPPAVAAAGPKLAGWAALFASKAADAKKETELLGDFVRDVFADLLGYAPPPADPYTLKTQPLVKVDGKFADAALGRFAGGADAVAVVLEGKGPRDPLDRPFAGRKRSAVEQALQYAVQLRIDWYLVTNLRETRLYHKGHDTFTYERFDTAKLAADPAERNRFAYLLGADRVLSPAGNHLNALLADSKKAGRELTNQFYAEYRGLRERTFAALRRHNPDRDPARLLAATQKILDRVLFVAFCEDRHLLPADIVSRAYAHADPFNPRPIWDNFKGLFRSVDQGNKALDIWKYNGGLFAADVFLDSLLVPDDVCDGFRKLAEYEYNPAADADAPLVDVDILGHVFEQSISDLEEMHKAVDAGGPSGFVGPAVPDAGGGPDEGATPSGTAGPTKPTRAVPAGPTKRKREGAFYTPEFVTRYVVGETLGPVLAERFDGLRRSHEAAAAKATRKVLADPAAFDPADLTRPQTAALAAFWRAWLDELETVRVVDPACGSGAFLLEAFNQMYAAYRRAEDYLVSLASGSGLFEPNRTILTRNLFGVDLNGEAVEIARLSCWIKTAEYGKVLTTLDDNITQGNSVVADPDDPLTAWRKRFPAAFAAGGFDVVVGNPPYVRQEWIKADKPYLEKHYRAYDGVADLYVYFYELGLNVLKPGGRLGYIVTNKWMKAGYGEPLRRLYGEAAWVESVVDFGHAKQIFPDADVFPSILVARKPSDVLPPPQSVRACVIPRDLLRIDDLARQIREAGSDVPRERFGPAAWNLEPPGVAALMDMIKANGVPLKEYAGCSPLYGVKTGCNEAFIVDTLTRDRLIAEHPSSEAVLKKYLRGQDIDRWASEWAGEWMIFARRGIDIDAYPAIKRHLEQYRTQLEPKPKDFTGTEWAGRKAGAYRWYELQDPVDYWQQFSLSKIGYQVIQFHPSYCFDTDGMLGNDKTFFIPTNDLFLLGVLNSPLMWWHNWRHLVHLKDEALSPMGYLMEQLPIPTPTDAVRTEVESLVAKLIDLKGRRTDGVRAVLQWLQSEFGVGKPTQKLAALVGLSPEGLVAEVKKGRPKTPGLSVADVKRLRDEHAASVVPLQAIDREMLALERRVSDHVNVAFGLTPADVALMWATAPPRMPLPAPE